MVRIVDSLTAVLQGKLALVREALIGARSRKDRRGAGRSGGNGSRPAPRPHEHVHRPGEERPYRDRREPWGPSIRTSSMVPSAAEFGRGAMA